jgi:DNA-binding response OmpR family regulator
LIEDDKLVANAMRRMLEALNCEVRHAKDGKVGLAECREWRPRVALIDVKLPQLNGDDVAKVILKELGDEAPAVFMVSGLKTTKILSLPPGVKGVFEKPVGIVQIYEAIAPYLE